ncbi:MAG TPA: GNAT family N-acetyltransferase [Caldilineaceae bacterium]|nr:GNAT family N-acetyltransferase [Caldilineaceae bacterium]
MPYEIQPYDPAMTPAYLALARLGLGDGGAVRKTEAFWQWKHVLNPFGRSSGLHAWDPAARQVVALRVLLRWRFVDSAGQTLCAARAVDTVTHPAYRRQGIFRTLTTQAVEQLAQEGTDLIFNTPNQKSLPGYLSLGWQPVLHAPLYLRPLRPLRIARRLVGQRLLGQAAPTSEAAGAGNGSGPVAWTVFRRRFGDEIDRLTASWETARPRHGVRTARTPSYLDWRYGAHPQVEYLVCPLVERPAERLVGYAVLRPNVRGGLQEAVLVEMALAEPDAGLGCRLMEVVAKQVRSDYLICHFAPASFEHRMVRANGFWRIPGRSITLVARGLSDEGLPARLQWDLTLGDLEVF